MGLFFLFCIALGWNKELVAPLVQWVPSGLRRCGMTNEEFPDTPLPSPELTGTSDLVPGSRYHYDGQKHQGPEKIGGYTQKRMQSNPECNKAFLLQRPSPLKDASLSLLLSTLTLSLYVHTLFPHHLLVSKLKSSQASPCSPRFHLPQGDSLKYSSNFCVPL